MAAATGLIANAIVMTVPMMPASVPIEAAPEAPRSVSGGLTVARTTDGLFHVDGAAAAGRVDFIVDTGATLTVLTPRDARRLAARFVSGLGSEGALRTAGGRATVTHAEIDNLAVAGQRVGPVRVAVVDHGLGQSLLGQDVLSRLGRLVIADDRLIISPTTSD